MLQNQHLRRMQWAITSPSLMAFPVATDYFKDEAHKTSILAKLEELDKDPCSVNAFFEGLGELPMGKYFEQLIFFLIKHDTRYELLLSNHQIREGQRTIGEIDLIIKDTQTKLIEHWEICLKYYLQSLPSEDRRLMIGPNAIDNLARKSEKLLNHQLRLSNHSSIKYLTGVKRIEPKLLMKGQFFYHLNEVNSIPKDANEDHETGWWCFFSEVDKLVGTNLHWTTLWKPEWIGPYSAATEEKMASSKDLISTLKNHFDNENHSILAVGVKQTEHGWMEQTRGFVVNDSWPHLIPQQG